MRKREKSWIDKAWTNHCSVQPGKKWNSRNESVDREGTRGAARCDFNLEINSLFLPFHLQSCGSKFNDFNRFFCSCDLHEEWRRRPVHMTWHQEKMIFRRRACVETTPWRLYTKFRGSFGDLAWCGEKISFLFRVIEKVKPKNLSHEIIFRLY